eukprot:TRINITY_DN12619_c0_g1_i1.p1 TRINITY_DN12619_c0_g1~~TRINITY_DN12619_c0_g1_i1.p1  ORF type:complete len:238 (-),score=13.43 TRINITY_DN12619_c0_g1_i1:38-751(-)
MRTTMRRWCLSLILCTVLISCSDARWYVQQYCADSACNKPTLTNVRVLDACIPRTLASNPVSTSCNTTHLSIFSCSADCMTCQKNATVWPLETAIKQSDGSFQLWTCLQDFPALPSDSRVIVSYDNSQCTGKTTYDNFVIGFTRPRCAPTSSAFFDTSCSNNMFTSSRCSDSTCSSNCTVTVSPIDPACNAMRNQTIICGSSFSLPKVNNSSLMSFGILQVVLFVLLFIYQDSFNKK